MVAAPLKSVFVRNKQSPRRVISKAQHEYKIKKIRSSQSSMIFFAFCPATKQRVVIKILRNYKDSRYSLADSNKRLTCQIEALKWNQKFTPGIYLGLGSIGEMDLNCIEQNALENRLDAISIRNITNNIDQLANISHPTGEYALVMECLPKERRLDTLLQKKNTASIYKVLATLVKRIVEMHESAPYSDIDTIENKEKRWGSYEQLKDKLLHNISLFNNLECLDDQSFYETYRCLKEDLLEIIQDPAWLVHFNTRLEHNRIKRCHGDLKARNIWIEPTENSNDPAHSVRLLDAIDFNPSYCNIDVLSDIAMLIVDIQAVDTHLHEHDNIGSRGWELAQFIIKTYCAYANEEEHNETTQLVLTYYLLEKALVRGSISLFYDRNEHPQLGPYFLTLAKEYMTRLTVLLYKAQAVSL